MLSLVMINNKSVLFIEDKEYLIEISEDFFTSKLCNKDVFILKF